MLLLPFLGACAASPSPRGAAAPAGPAPGALACGQPPPADPPREWQRADSLHVLAGRVCMEPAGRPLAGIRVVATMGGREWAAITDSSGRYELRDLPEGEAQVTVRHIGFYRESRAVRLACRTLLLPAAGPAAGASRAPEYVACSDRAWLAFYLRPL